MPFSVIVHIAPGSTETRGFGRLQLILNILLSLVFFFSYYEGNQLTFLKFVPMLPLCGQVQNMSFLSLLSIPRVK